MYNGHQNPLAFLPISEANENIVLLSITNKYLFCKYILYRYTQPYGWYTEPQKSRFTRPKIVYLFKRREIHGVQS